MDAQGNISDFKGLPGHMKILQLDPENANKVVKDYSVLVNPSSYQVSYSSCFAQDQAIGATETHFRFNKAKAQTMGLALLFDSTGSLGNNERIQNKSVLTQIEEFLAVAYTEQHDFAAPKMMMLIWGPMEFYGVLEAISITYSHFDAFGEPIRATASCTFKGGNVNFDTKKSDLVSQNGAPIKVVDFTQEKHGINLLQTYGGYMALLAKQPLDSLPNTLRKASELSKIIIR